MSSRESIRGTNEENLLELILFSLFKLNIVYKLLELF